MEYAEDKVFKISYDNGENKKRKKIGFINMMFRRNAFFQIIVFITIILSVMNTVLIYNFLSLLLKI